QLAGAEEVLLADELVQRPRPHPRGQRPGPVEVRLALGREQVVGLLARLLHGRPSGPVRAASSVPEGERPRQRRPESGSFSLTRLGPRSSLPPDDTRHIAEGRCATWAAVTR